MEKPNHTLTDLFAQLGLAASSRDIDEFVAAHAPLASGVTLGTASFWTPAQATFLHEKILDDADWAGVIDQLNERLSG